MMKPLAAAVRTVAMAVPILSAIWRTLAASASVSYGAWMIYQSGFEVMVAIRRLPLSSH